MGAQSTTVIAVIAEAAEAAEAAEVAVASGPARYSQLHGAANVHMVETDRGAPALERAVAAWREAVRTTAPYTVHDADPLAAVAEAWIRRFDGSGPAGELEVAVSETLARWRARSLDLPDYYLLLDPEDWEITRRHWYLGFLAGAAPARVVAADARADLRAPIGRLPAGRWWPELDALLTGIDRIVPDRAGLPGAAGGVALLGSATEVAIDWRREGAR